MSFNEVDFLHAVKISFKVIQLFLMEMDKHFRNFQNSNLAISLHYLIKENREEIDFCMQINIKVPYKLILRTWSSKFPKWWYNHFWWVWSSTPKLLKVTDLKYLYNISKMKLWMKFIFVAFRNINIKVSASWHYCFWWM